MTPAARIAAAMAILDQVLAGAPAEKTLTTWGRQSRYAGSGDRAAVRDHVFDALRCQRSFGWIGGAETGRAILIGALRAAGRDPAEVLTGGPYGAAPLSDADPAPRDPDAAPRAVRLDIPDWLLPEMQASLGEATEPVLQALRHRAPVFLRCNLRKTTPLAAARALAQDGIETRPHSLSPTALEVLTNPRKVQNSQGFQAGLVELQDAASQAVVDLLPLRPGARVLDYCAGGGGKALAMAARADISVTAHDTAAHRMQDIPARAARAGVEIACLATGDLTEAAYDLVLCDAPCSGSGSWRRTPEAKWRLTPERLAELTDLQSGILERALPLVAPGGCLAYVTCSLLKAENQDRITGFLDTHPGWRLAESRQFTPLEGGDGFFFALLVSRQAVRAGF